MNHRFVKKGSALMDCDNGRDSPVRAAYPRNCFVLITRSTPTCNKAIVLDLKLASESEKAVEVIMQVGVMNGYTEYQSN